MERHSTLGGLLALLLLAGCSSPCRAPDLRTLYDRSAQYHDEHRNPVIVIPGILGSRLTDGPTGRVVWGAFAGDYANPNDPEGARLVALPMRSGAPLAELRDGVTSPGVLDRLKVEFLGLPVEQAAYLNILRVLGVGGYRDEELGLKAIDYGKDHFTCFQFPYDWRRDNVENARKLHEFILERKAYVQREIEKRFGVKDRDVQLDIVAHSMGGLIARYYLMYGAQELPAEGPPKPTWEGRRHVDRVILVGTPNAGSIEAVFQQKDGIRFASILPKYEAAVLGTFPSIYQLFPRVRHKPLVYAEDRSRSAGDFYRVEFWEKLGWGLASREQDPVLQVLLPDVSDPAERRRIALDHLRKCLERAERFAAALDAPAAPPAGVSLYLLAGDAKPTSAVAHVDGTARRIVKVEKGPGDGTVLRTSALLDERQGRPWSPSLVSPIRWRQVMFLFSDHLGMTKDPAFTDNVLYLLLDDPRESYHAAGERS